MSFDYCGALYRTEHEAAVACAYDWVSAGGNNQPADIEGLTAQHLMDELRASDWDCPPGLDLDAMEEAVEQFRTEEQTP